MKNMQVRKAQQGFTLIELMIVIAIVGILAAIALPAYQDYTVRARMSEALATMAEAKTTIAEFAAARGSMPADADQAGILTGNFGVESVILSADIPNATTTVITYELITSNTTQLGDAASMTVRLRGTLNENSRRVQWECGPADATLRKFLPASCRDDLT
ncbi:MAG: pilin [Pseudomonadota bacterium]